MAPLKLTPHGVDGRSERTEPSMVGRIGIGLSCIDDDEWSWAVERWREGQTAWGSQSELVADGCETSRAEARAAIRAAVAKVGVELKDCVVLPF